MHLLQPFGACRWPYHHNQSKADPHPASVSIHSSWTSFFFVFSWAQWFYCVIDSWCPRVQKGIMRVLWLWVEQQKGFLELCSQRREAWSAVWAKLGTLQLWFCHSEECEKWKDKNRVRAVKILSELKQREQKTKLVWICTQHPTQCRLFSTASEVIPERNSRTSRGFSKVDGQRQMHMTANVFSSSVFEGFC